MRAAAAADDRVNDAVGFCAGLLRGALRFDRPSAARVGARRAFPRRASFLSASWDAARIKKNSLG